MSTSRRQTHSRRTSVSSGDSPIEPPKEKFRSACDACAASKVRCTKEQPICQRCARLDIECVYGLSQRRGKPPMNRDRELSVSGPILPETDVVTAAADRLTLPSGLGWPRGLETEGSYSSSSTGVATTEAWGTFQAGGTTLSPPYIASPGLQPAGSYGTGDQLFNLSNPSFPQYTTPSSYSLPGTVPAAIPFANTNLATCVREALETLALLYSPQQSSIPISVIAPMVASTQTPQTTDFTYPSLEVIRVCINSLDRLAACTCTDCLSDRSRLYMLMTIASKINHRLQGEYGSLATQVPAMQNYGPPPSVYAPQWGGAGVMPTFSHQAGAFAALSTQPGGFVPVAQNLLFIIRGLEAACGRLSTLAQSINNQTALTLLQSFLELLGQSINHMKLVLERLVAGSQ